MKYFHLEPLNAVQSEVLPLDQRSLDFDCFKVDKFTMRIFHINIYFID